MVVTTAGAATERPRRLDRERVVVTAEEIVDRDGYDALSTTLLAGELDTRVSSLYNHVANLEDLRSEVQLAPAMRLLSRPGQRAAMRHAGRRGLEVLSHELRTLRPHLPAALRRDSPAPHRPRGLLRRGGRGAEGLVGATARSAGVDGRRIIALGMAHYSSLHGFVALEMAGYFDGVPGLRTFAQVGAALVTAALGVPTDV